jgi:hypothetical protein
MSTCRPRMKFDRELPLCFLMYTVIKKLQYLFICIFSLVLSLSTLVSQLEVRKQIYLYIALRYRLARVEYSRFYFTEIFSTQRTITISSLCVKVIFRKIYVTHFLRKSMLFYNHF